MIMIIIKYNDNENDHSKCYNNGTLKINSW